MTTVSLITKKCGLCNAESRQADPGIRWKGEPFDLDTRPSGAARTSIYMWMQHCHSCGYCSPDISSYSETTKTIVESENYKSITEDKKYSDSARSFLCWALIQSAEKDYAEAGWAALHAAWVCDDDPQFRPMSSECRKTALHHFDQAHFAHQTFADSPQKELLIKIDILRRCGYFDQASAYIEKALSGEPDSYSYAILTYQEDLIEEKDIRCHRIEDAVADLDQN